MSAQKKAKILLIYTGGTIGMVKDYKSGSLKAFNFDKLLKHIPELNQLDCTIDSVSFENPIDSSNMNTSYWVEIASIIEENYDTHDGFVVLHGSDTMSYSASALSFMLENLAKPVIFTGSQLPIGDLRTDAKENLITSIQIASLQSRNKPVIREVGLYFEYKLYRGNRTTKVNAEHFEAFSSPNYPELAESGVHLKINRPFLLGLKSSRKKFQVHKVMSSNVGSLKLFPGISPNVVESVLKTKDMKVLVLETYGAGNAPTDEWFIAILKKAIAQGLHIINITQCSGGSVMMGHYETSEILKRIQLVNGKDITFEAAITKAMYLIGSGVSEQLFKTIFETSLRGEMQ
ncbi:asparaginase [Croceitalea sp. MTPC9]|uniref:asparaginase n=1 Tax=unclassified Croceitalea TaxID=2632280 RepID=UPI002B3BC0F0|nr:asparaginase [Croceitalea sp. MTPC6]GMN17574.1 asparaginase [Croceitalea sp. MTPC9]